MIKEAVQNIEENCFGTDLKKSLFELKSKHPETPEIDVLINLCRRTLGSNNNVPKFDKFLDEYSDLDSIKNKELLARWREYLSFRFKNQKKVHLRQAVFQYLEVFSINNKHDYLIHSLRLVKTTKGLFKDELEKIYETAKKVVLNLDKPFLQKEIIVELFSFFPEKTRVDFEEFLNNEVEHFTTNHDFSSVVWLLEALKEIKAISKVKYKIMLAENYEKEGDHQSEDKKPNTYYPTILFTYQKGLRELKSISCDENLRKRLEDKVLQEQKEHLKMHSALSTEFLDVNKAFEDLINDFGDSCISQNEIFDFHTGLNSLITFPICLSSDINSESENQYFFSQFFNTYTRIDSKGKVVGETSTDNYREIENKRFWRECIINFLKKAKWRMDSDKIINKDAVYFYIIEKCNSIFIPPDRKWLFANGIYAGFNNDFVTCAHVLVPQLENSLKYILESQGVLTAKIYEEIQHDNMFGGILDTYIKINGHDIFRELKDFLLENSSVNFRNELCHGLLSPFIIEHYGIYVWWLTMKMIFDKEKIFEIKSTKR